MFNRQILFQAADKIFQENICGYHSDECMWKIWTTWLADGTGDDADLDSMFNHFNKAIADTAAELGKQCRKRKRWVTPEILDRCEQRQDFDILRGDFEGAIYYMGRVKRIWYLSPMRAA